MSSASAEASMAAVRPTLATASMSQVAAMPRPIGKMVRSPWMVS
jgi:hypothetical protein